MRYFEKNKENLIKSVRVIKSLKLKKNDETLKKFYEYLKRKNIKEVLDVNQADLIVSFGGDGTMLIAASEALINNIPIIAVNMGTLGYLAEINPKDILEMMDKYEEGDYSVDERNFLEINYNGEKYYGLNELVIIKGGSMSKLIEVEVYSNDIFVNKYRADGVIIATPTGSTAYSLSAGGPIVNPSLNAMTITPLSPQSLTARPIIIDGKEKLTFIVTSRDNDIHLNIDGSKCFYLDPKDKISASLSNKKIKIIRSGDKDYYSILREKLKWGKSSLN